MIKNERQYRIAKAHADSFERAIASAQAKPSLHIHPRLQEAQLEGMRSQLVDLQQELEEYITLQRQMCLPF